MKFHAIPAIIALSIALSGCGDKDIPEDAFVCAGAVSQHQQAFGRNMIVVGIAEAAEGYRIIDYRLEPTDPARPGRRRATCKMAFPTDASGRKVATILQISLDADKPLEPANRGGIRNDIMMAETIRGGLGNLGFDAPGYRWIGIFIGAQPRCSDMVDLEKRTAALYSFDRDKQVCVLASTQPFSTAPCPAGQVNSYDGGPAAWNYVNQADRPVQVAACIDAATFQRNKLP